MFLCRDRFGEDLDLLHGFGEAFTEETGAKIVNGFTFDQPRTNTAHTLEGVVALLEVSTAVIVTLVLFDCIPFQYFVVYLSNWVVIIFLLRRGREFF